MKKRNILSLIIVCIFICFTFAGCGTKAEVKTETQKKLVDMAGRELNIPGKIEKVFSTNPAGSCFIYTINPDLLIGWNYVLSDGEKKYMDSKYKDLPSFGGAGKEGLNYEEIIKADPDIIIVIGTINDATKEQADQIEEKVNKPVVVINDDINKAPEVYEFLGKILGKEDKAKELGGYCKKTLDLMAEKSSEIKEKKKIYYAEGTNGLTTSMNLDVMKIAGVVNVADESSSQPTGQVSIEQVLKWNPEIIISWDDERGGYYSKLFKDEAWASISAVKNKKIYEVQNKPFNWINRPGGINRILGMQWLGALVYPETFDYNMEQVVKEFYEKFYHYKLDDQGTKELLKNNM